MRERNQEAENRCQMTDFSAKDNCEGAIKWGLNESVYKERKALLKKCDIGPEERVALYATPIRLRSESPIIIHAENCRREIMLGHQ